MSLPEEQQRIDVTTGEKRYAGRPPSPRRPGRRPRPPRKSAVWAALARLGRRVAVWAATVFLVALIRLSRPTSLIALAGLIGALTYLHLHTPAVDTGPALPRAGWRASAYPPGDAAAAIDGDPTTRWAGRHAQGEWFAVDMGRRRTFHRVVLDAGEYADDYPREYAVYASGDGVHWGTALASGEGTGPVTIADFARTSARYVKVVQVAPDAQATWSLCEFTVH